MNTRSRSVAQLLLLLSILLPDVALRAQRLEGGTFAVREAPAQISRTLLERPARLRIESATLAEALIQLQASSGVPIAFSPTLLPRVEVQCDCEGITVEAALRRLLSGTPFTFADVGAQVVIELPLQRRPEQRPNAAVTAAASSGTTDDAQPMPSALLFGTEDQEVGTIGGRVTQTGGAPLPSAQVFVVGTSLGGLTDENGRFAILRVPEGTRQVRVQRIGYGSATASATVRRGETVQVNFELKEEVLGLDEIVVTGTAGAARRREIGNSISQVNLAKAIDRPVNVEAALQAQAPGVTVMASSGQPGSASQIRLRGNVSVSMSNQPLVYIDGVRMRSEPYPKNDSGGESDNRSNNEVQSPLNDLNPADIERIEIIKGAAATTLYGTEAAAGVIQIFTKRGESAAPQWTLEVDQGFSKLQPFAPEPAPFIYLEPWLKNAHRQKYNASVRGGGRDLNYFVSGTMEDNEGVLPTDHEERASIRGNFGFTGLRGLQMQWSNFYTRSETQTTPTGNNSHGLLLNVYRQESNFVGSREKAVIDRVLEYDTRSMIDRLTTGLTATYAPIANWTNRFTAGYDLSHNELRQIRPFGFIQAPEGRISDVIFRSRLLTLDFVSTYDIDVRSDLRTSLSVGGQSVTTDEHTLDGYSANFPGPSKPTLTTGAARQSFESAQRVINGGLFGQSLIAFKDRFFLTLGVRVDGNSAFGSDFGLQPYPKASLSYVISDEGFWPDALGTLKMRAAYGHAGRAPGAFDAVKTWDPIGWGGLPAYLPRTLGNPDLGPERTAESEFGFDWAPFGGRVTADFTYYRQITSDALFAVRQVPSLGFSSSQLRNIGKIQNQGVELALNGTVIERERLTWSVGVNVAKSASEVLDLGGAPEFSLGNNGWIIEGQPVPVIRGTRLVNGSEIADPITETNFVFGPNQPTLVVGLNTTLELPLGFSVAARGEYQGGHYITDSGTANAQSRGIKSWPTCIRAYAEIDAGRAAQLSAYDRQFCVASNYKDNSHIYPADFFKLREVSARAPLPFKVPGATSSYLTVSARNWFRWLNSDFPIFDPEMMGNEGAAAPVRGMGEHYPVPATFTASLKLVF